MWLKRRRGMSADLAFDGKVDENMKIIGFLGTGAFLGSTDCCGLRFCYVWRPTLCSKCPRWVLSERMSTENDSGRELVKFLEYRSRTMFSLSRSTNSIKINKIKLNSDKLDCRRSND